MYCIASYVASLDFESIPHYKEVMFRTLIFCLIVAIGCGALAKPLTLREEQQLKKKAMDTFWPNSTPERKKAYCWGGEKISADDYVIECVHTITCGPEGKLYIFRRKGRSFQKKLEVETGGYMGGDFWKLIDLDGDSQTEVVVIGQTDGVVESEMHLFRLSPSKEWVDLAVEESCGKMCRAHDFVFTDLDDDKTRQIAALDACGIERSNGQACRVAIGWIRIREGKLALAALEDGNQNILDKTVLFALDPSREGADRTDAFLSGVREIYDELTTKPRNLDDLARRIPKPDQSNDVKEFLVWARKGEVSNK